MVSKVFFQDIEALKSDDYERIFPVRALNSFLFKTMISLDERIRNL